MNSKLPFLLALALLNPVAGRAAGDQPASPESDPKIAALAARAVALQSLDRFPVPRHIVPPVCSDDWGPLNDRVVVAFFIDEQGRVERPYAVSGNNAVLRDAALAVVAQWRFDPPLRKGVPTLVAARQVFAFAPKRDSSKQTGVTFSANTWGPVAGADSSLPEIHDISELDPKTPWPISETPPKYPFEMRRAGLSGQVIVDFIVDTNGDVQNAYAASSTHPNFEQPAVSAVSKWKFRPGLVNGVPVNTHVIVPVIFALKKELYQNAYQIP